MSNRQIVDDFVAAWKTRDIDRVMAFIAPDCVYHNIPWPPVQGEAEIRKTLKGFLDMAEAIEFVVHRTAEGSDGVVMNERTDRFRIKGKWLELPVTGVFEIKGGKIAAWRDYFDAGQFQSQMAEIQSAAQ